MGDFYGEVLQRSSEHLALMATQNPLLPIGQWVQYNVSTQNPRAKLPTSDESGIGQVRQSFTKADGTYYQIVWNPGAQNPVSGLYHQDQLCALDQQQASDIRSQIAQGTYTPNQGTPGQDYQQPNIPVQAAPPSMQQPGMETL